MWRWRLRSVTSSTDSSTGNSNTWCDSTSSASCCSSSTRPPTSSSTSLSGAGSVASCAIRFSSRSASVAAPRPWRTTSSSSSSHASLHRDCSIIITAYTCTRCTDRLYQASLSRTAGLLPSADQPQTYLLTSPVLVYRVSVFYLSCSTIWLHVFCTRCLVSVRCTWQSGM